jgi:hypothetical protein
MKKVTPYQLATLASRIDPERCARDRKRALDDAVDLLERAESALWRAKEEEAADEAAGEAYLKWLDKTRKDWVRGLKEITGERRRERATRRFTEFMEHRAPGKDLSHYKRDGFTLTEIRDLQHDFTNWKKQPKRKKGKQGRRISESDGRLRIGRLRLAATKPQRAA